MLLSSIQSLYSPFQWRLLSLTFILGSLTPFLGISLRPRTFVRLVHSFMLMISALMLTEAVHAAIGSWWGNRWSLILGLSMMFFAACGGYFVEKIHGTVSAQKIWAKVTLAIFIITIGLFSWRTFVYHDLFPAALCYQTALLLPVVYFHTTKRRTWLTYLVCVGILGAWLVLFAPQNLMYAIVNGYPQFTSFFIHVLVWMVGFLLLSQGQVWPRWRHFPLFLLILSLNAIFAWLTNYLAFRTTGVWGNNMYLFGEPNFHLTATQGYTFFLAEIIIYITVFQLLRRLPPSWKISMPPTLVHFFAIILTLLFFTVIFLLAQQFFLPQPIQFLDRP
jgi:hypothetical protein